MKITGTHPDAVHIVALDTDGRVISHLMEIDTEKMEGFRVGEIVPVKIAELIDRRNGKQWRPTNAG